MLERAINNIPEQVQTLVFLEEGPAVSVHGFQQNDLNRLIAPVGVWTVNHAALNHSYI